jgi:hypothetical protein
VSRILKGRYQSGPSATEDRSACIRQRSSQAYEHRPILQRCAPLTFFSPWGPSLTPASLFITHTCGNKPKQNSTCHTLVSVSICVRRNARDEKKLMIHHKVYLPSAVLAVPVLERPRASGRTLRRVCTRISVLQGSRTIYLSSRSSGLGAMLPCGPYLL